MIDVERALRFGRTVSEVVARVTARCVADGVASIWPERCWLCGRAAPGDACPEHALEPGFVDARCGRCASRLPAGVAPGRVCRGCRRRAPRFVSVHAAADYDRGALREWLLAFKHGGRPELARPLARFVEQSFERESPRPDDLLVPVPLHAVRWFERGYDQAALLAGHIARAGHGRFVPLLKRRRATPPQGAPDAPARAANVRDAFVARCFVPPGPRVWLVDDVLASGATADACAGALRRAGAADVRVLVVARA